MITTFKIFERLGIDNTILKISEKIYSGFLENYNKKKEFTDSSDTFYTDITDLKKEFKFNLNLDKIGCQINYNKAESRGGFTIQIGIISRVNNEEIKSLYEIKGEILHEVQHVINAFRKEKNNKDIIKQKNFINMREFDNLMYNDLIGSFSNSNSNTYGMKISTLNFMKCNLFTEQYKKLIIYLYISDKNEMMSKLHEFLPKIKELDNFKDISNNLSFFKDGEKFKINIDSFSTEEKRKLSKIFNPKDVKRVESYINNKCKKFIIKVHKLSYFRTE